MTNMGAGNIASNVLRCITRTPGSTVYIQDIMDDTGLDAAQVRRALSHQRTLGKNPGNEKHDANFINDVVRGSAWMYVPNKVAKPIEVVQETPKHRVLSRRTYEPTVQETVTYVPPVAKPIGDTFIKMGTTSSGEIVVKDEKGKLFKVEPL